LDIPISAFISSEDDYGRKPRIGMFDLYLEKSGKEIDLE
jgi:hypothetical protein